MNMVAAATTPIENPVNHKKSFLIKYKQQVLNTINDLMLLGHTLCNAIEKLNIPHSYHRRWGRTVSKVDTPAAHQPIVPFKIHGESHKIHRGHPSGIIFIEGNLKCLIFELWEQGLQVNSHTLTSEATRLSYNFKAKSTKEKVSSMRCFVKRVGPSH
jgi:hypothetical protein